MASRCKEQEESRCGRAASGNAQLEASATPESTQGMRVIVDVMIYKYHLSNSYEKRPRP